MITKRTKRRTLRNGCSISNPAIYPANWDRVGASTASDWYIHYRFYDPTLNSGDPFNNGKLCVIKGMNQSKTLAERRAITKSILENEIELLDDRGYNPIRKIFNKPDALVGDITDRSPLLASLQSAYDKLRCEEDTKKDVRTVLKYAGEAIAQLKMATLPLVEVRKKHIRLILDQCAENQNKRAADHKGAVKRRPAAWSADRHNKYRTLLMILFNEFCELDAIDINPVKGTSKRKAIKKIRQVLTPEELTQVSEVLKVKNYRFWIFLNIFYPSGSREVELLRLRAKNVNLKRQKFIRLVKKGKAFEEVETTIIDAALPYWKIAMEGCAPEDYIFSVGLVPGKRMIRKEQITRRWHRAVKVGMGIGADCYSLKHLFTTRVVDSLSEADAASHNAHKDTAMVVNIYDTEQSGRKHERMKKVNINFS